MAKAKKTDDNSLSKLEELFGIGTIVKASEVQNETVKEWTSTGSISLDRALGGKGVPKGGKTTAIVGKESASKTTLALHIIAEEQKKGNDCAFLDVEDTLDLDYAKKIGVNLDKLHVIKREALLKGLGIKDRVVVSGEEWLETLCKLLKFNIHGIIVMDSIAALWPAAEIENGIEGGRMAGVASMMSKAYRAVNGALTTFDGGFVYLNQYRMNPGGYGNPYVEPGGEAWKYLQAVKIEISKSLDKDTEGVHGLIVKGKITKSKVCDPYQEFEYYVQFGKGIVRVWEIYNLALEVDLIKKGGAWFELDGLEEKIQGEEKVIEYLEKNPEYTEALYKKALEI